MLRNPPERKARKRYTQPKKTAMRILLTIILFFTISQYSLAQDTSGITEPWKDVKIWLVKRAQTTKRLMTSLDKNKGIPKGLETRPEKVADSLEVQMNSHPTLDSLTVHKLESMNSNLTDALEPLIDFLNDNPKLKFKADLLELQVQLAAIENRLETAARDFNKRAISLGQRGICFTRLGTSSPPEVKF